MPLVGFDFYQLLPVLLNKEWMNFGTKQFDLYIAHISRKKNIVSWGLVVDIKTIDKPSYNNSSFREKLFLDNN